MANVEKLSLADNIAKVRVVVSPDEVNKQYKKIFRELRKNINIPGFRKGKIPPNIIRQRIGNEQITGAVADELKNFVLEQALDELGMTPRHGDTVWHEEAEPVENEAAEFEVSIPVLPEVELPDYRSFELSVPYLDVTDEMRDTFRRRLLRRYTKLEDKDGPAAEADAAQVSFTSVDTESEEDSPLAASELEYYIGDEGNFPGWDEQITGMSAGETREFDFTVPEDFSDPRVAGNPHKVSLTVNKVMTRDEPELNEEFVKETLQMESMEQFEEFLDETLSRERDQQYLQMKSETALNSVLDKLEVEISEDMITDELDGLVKDYDRQLRQSGSSLDEYLKDSGKTLPEYRESLKPAAIRKIKTFLTVKAISEQEGIQAQSEDFQRYAMYLMQYEGVPPDQIRELMKNHDFMREATYQILREKVLLHLAEAVPFESKESDDEASETKGSDGGSGELEADEIGGSSSK